MLKINILSPELKKEVKYKYFYRSLRAILYLLIISILTHSALILTAKYILNVHANETNNRNILVNTKTEDYDKKVKNINKQVEYIAKIQEETVNWSDFMAFFSKSISKGIKITSISIDQNSNSFSINGVADTRQNLLNFKSSIEDLGLFGDLSIPMDKLLMKKNINFSFNTKFKSYDFK